MWHGNVSTISDLFFSVLIFYTYCSLHTWTINRPPHLTKKQVNESKPVRGVESLTHYCWRREPSVSVASMSLRLVEVIPLQLASLWYEDQLRSEQWKTWPLRVEATLARKSHLIPIKQFDSWLLIVQLLLQDHNNYYYSTAEIFLEDIINLHKPAKGKEKTEHFFWVVSTTKTLIHSWLCSGVT